MLRPREAVSGELSAEPLPDPVPGWLFRAGRALHAALGGLRRRLVPPERAVFEHCANAGFLYVLHAVVAHGVPDLLGEVPLSAPDLAQRGGLDPDALFRALRGCTTKGYFRLRRDGSFEHTSRSRALRVGHHSCSREFLLYFCSGSNLEAWSRFDHALRTGGSPFGAAHDMNVWEWFEQHPDEGETFARAMMGLSAADAPIIARLYPFEEIHQICDVGGGRGTLLSELLLRFPHLHGILCDTPGVLGSAEALLAARGVLNRVELVPGDFFERVPSGADAYLLANVLHDWDDARCVRILRNVRAAGELSRVLVIETLLEHDSDDVMGIARDLQMMVACGHGRERSAAELTALLRAAGLRQSRRYVYPTLGILEAVPALSPVPARPAPHSAATRGA
jgi:hypothetical protein